MCVWGGGGGVARSKDGLAVKSVTRFLWHDTTSSGCAWGRSASVPTRCMCPMMSWYRHAMQGWRSKLGGDE